jgi:serine phosphatase RsbU (regulator of sigma subunit)
LKIEGEEPMSNGVNSSIFSHRNIFWRLAIQGPVEHARSFFCFWKPSIARRITVYFLVFGLIIFLFSTFLYMIAAKKTFLKSAGSVIQDRFSQSRDFFEGDFLMKRVGKSQPDIYRMFGMLSSMTSAYYAVSDVAFYTRSPAGPGWTRIYFRDDDVLQEEPAGNPSLQKLEHLLKRRFHPMQANLIKTDGKVTLFVNLTGEKDVNNYFLGIELDGETFSGFIRHRFLLFLQFLLICMVVSRLLAHIFVRKIARPIEKLSEIVSKIAKGDLTHNVPVTTRDEIGQLAADINTMMAELREWERIKRIEFELEKGQEIQREFLPRIIPDIPNWEIATWFQPAGKVSGDFYDVFMLQDGHLGLVIGDVCDKGVGSALYMALFRSLIRVFSTQRGLQQKPVITDRPETASCSSQTISAVCEDPADCLQAVSLTNDYIARIHGDEGMFATIFFGVLDPSSGRLTYVNGGHEPLQHIGAGGVKGHLNPTGPAVGMMPDMSFGIQQVCLAPGDILLGYTDGLTEARSLEDELYTRRRLNTLFGSPEETAGQLLKRIQSNLLAFIGTASQNDDITMLIVQRNHTQS